MLVVDDDPSLRLLCRVNLELEGYRVIEAESVDDRARRARRRRASTSILLDVHLGNEDGLALLPAIERAGAARSPC